MTHHTTASLATSAQLKTPEQVRQELRRRGISIASWADEHGVQRATAYNLLYGRLSGARGAAHRGAVLLGLKAGEV